MSVKENINSIFCNSDEVIVEEATELGCSKLCMNNVVTEDKLKKIQEETLSSLREFLSKTYGPMGSYTAIVKGDTIRTISSDYSKDGLKVLKNIIFDSPLEMSSCMSKLH